MKKNHKTLFGLVALTALAISACTNSPSPSSPSSSGEPESSITSEPSSSIVPTSSDSSSSSQIDPEYEKPVISGVEDLGVYIIGKQRVAPTFNVGEATLKRDDEDPIPFASGEEINESGTYTLKVVNGDKSTSVTFMLKYEKPVVSGVEQDGVYEEPVTITFTCGTATLSKDGGEAKVFEKGSVVSEFGLYKLIVKNGDETVEINFTIQAETPKIDGVKDGGIYANKAVPTFNNGSATLSKDGGEAVGFESGEAITEAGQYKLVVTLGDKKAEASFEVYEHEIQKGAIESFTDIDSWTKESEKGKIERKKDGSDYYMEVTKESDFDFYMYKRVNVNFLQNKYLAIDVEGLNGFVPDTGFQIELLNDNGVWDVMKVSAADAILVTSGEAQHGGNRNIFYFKISDDKFAGKEIENVQVKIYVMWGGEKIVIPYSLNIVADEDMPLVVQGIKDKGIYSVEEKVKATFDVGEATLSKDGGTPVAYVSGTEITSGKGHYLLSVSKGTDNLNLEFDIVDPIFSGWACTSTTGAEVSFENGKLVFTNTNGSYSSVGRTITVNTVDHPTMKIMVNEDSDSRWVLKAKTSSMGANIAITPEEAKTGEVLIDLSLFDEFKDLEDEEVMFEFYVFNNNKLVIDEIMFDTPNPAFSGVVDGGIYTEVTPVVARGSATISKDGGDAVTFVSGTAIKEKGHYELIGSLGDKELTINFDVTDEIFTNWVSTNGAVVSMHNGNLNIKSTAGYCDAYRNIDNDVSQNPILVINFDESSTSQVQIKINNVNVGSQDVKKGVKTFDLRDYAELAELKTLDVHIYVFGTSGEFTLINDFELSNSLPRTVVLGSEVASWSADPNVSKQIDGDTTSVVLTGDPGYGCVSNTFAISADTYRFLVVDLSSDSNCTIKINDTDATTNAKTKTIIDLSNFGLVKDFETVKVQIYVFSKTVPATIKGIYGMTLEEYSEPVNE